MLDSASSIAPRSLSSFKSKGLRILIGKTVASLLCVSAFAAEPLMDSFEQEIQPVLDQYCYDCHGNGSEKGGVKLDEFENAEALRDHKLWLRALKNVRSHIMPPANKE